MGIMAFDSLEKHGITEVKPQGLPKANIALGIE